MTTGEVIRVYSEAYSDTIRKRILELKSLLFGRGHTKMDFEKHDQLFDEFLDLKNKLVQEVIQEVGDNAVAAFKSPVRDIIIVVHPSTSNADQYPYRITSFDDKGPMGHNVFTSKEEAISAAIGTSRAMENVGNIDYVYSPELKIV